ncbi:MAG: HEPN domain-containing protein [Candidatus Rokubacteria bacterium]|nr:HEPN domain-containing protein [Candidatus Rokubacteria bacterium]
MTNRERAQQLFAEALGIAEDMQRAVARGRFNLATRRAQEVIELVVKALLNEVGVEYPRTHDPAPVLVETIRQRRLPADPAFLEWLSGLSNRLAEIRGPAFYHEIEVGEAEARRAVDAAERVLGFGQEFLGRLEKGQ